MFFFFSFFFSSYLPPSSVPTPLFLIPRYTLLPPLLFSLLSSSFPSFFSFSSVYSFCFISSPQPPPSPFCSSTSCTFSLTFRSPSPLQGLKGVYMYKITDNYSSVRLCHYLFSTSPRPALGATQWVPRPLSPGVKRQWREADHSPPASAQVKKIHSLPHTPSWRRA
jgi:hypothetical protein